MGIIRKKRIEVIFSTYPIATALLIGYAVHRLSGKPWVVDFRDSMTEDDYPPDPIQRRAYRWLERMAVGHAARLVFTAPSARRLYLERYPSLNPARAVVIPNGYDEADFCDIRPEASPPRWRQRFELLHTGLIYPWERDPRPFFRALARLKQRGEISASTLKVNLRASGNEREYAAMLQNLRIADIVQLLPPLPYREVLAEGAQADGLLLFQAANCNHQIPAKVYEYLRLRKPILALADAAGDTNALLKEVGGATTVDLADEDAIVGALPSFLAAVRRGTHPLPDPARTGHYSREGQTRRLAECLDDIVGSSSC
jgi:glycosyltransferase involved in cell wall biosynthesis